MPNPPIQSLISDPFLLTPGTCTFKLTHIGGGVCRRKKILLGFDLPLGDGEIGLERNARYDACLHHCVCAVKPPTSPRLSLRLPVPSTLPVPLLCKLNALCGRLCGAFTPFGLWLGAAGFFGHALWLWAAPLFRPFDFPFGVPTAASLLKLCLHLKFALVIPFWFSAGGILLCLVTNKCTTAPPCPGTLCLPSTWALNYG